MSVAECDIGQTRPTSPSLITTQDVEPLRLLADGRPLGPVAHRMRTTLHRTQATSNRLGLGVTDRELVWDVHRDIP